MKGKQSKGARRRRGRSGFGGRRLESGYRGDRAGGGERLRGMVQRKWQRARLHLLG